MQSARQRARQLLPDTLDARQSGRILVGVRLATLALFRRPSIAKHSRVQSKKGRQCWVFRDLLPRNLVAWALVLQNPQLKRFDVDVLLPRPCCLQIRVQAPPGPAAPVMPVHALHALMHAVPESIRKSDMALGIDPTSRLLVLHHLSE